MKIRTDFGRVLVIYLHVGEIHLVMTRSMLANATLVSPSASNAVSSETTTLRLI